jgi:hypothetical protein
MTATKPSLSPIAIFLVAFGAAAIFALLPMRVMLQHFIYEDMFYYLRVAEFLATGQGSTFDGTAPTNGYHPAWMAISTLAAIGLDGNMLVRAMLLFAAALHGLQAVVLHRILLRFTAPTTALLITALFALNWRTISTNLCGLETPLSMLMLLIVIDYLSRRTPDDLARTGSVITLGALLGVSVYARFDMLLFSALVLAYIGILLWRETGFATALKQAVLGGTVVILALIPWFVFSYTVSGSLLPNSRDAVALLADQGVNFGSAPWLKERIFASIHWVSDNANFLGLWPTAVPTGRLSQIAALILVLFVLWVAASSFRARRELPSIFWFCLVFFVVHSAYYALNLRLEVRYVLPAFTSLLIALGLLLGNPTGLVALPRQRGPVLLSVMYVMATISGLHAWSKYHGTTRTHQAHGALYDTALWIQENAPDASVGAWNAGILSYFSRAEVVNLDGVINDEALAANLTGSIDAYIHARGITYLADLRGQIDANLGRFAATTDLIGDEVIRHDEVVVVTVR